MKLTQKEKSWLNSLGLKDLGVIECRWTDTEDDKSDSKSWNKLYPSFENANDVERFLTTLKKNLFAEQARFYDIEEDPKRHLWDYTYHIFTWQAPFRFNLIENPSYNDYKN